ncbi:VOC family protein [Paracoccus sp. 11-3]|uniref:VOC family protein n=1 Tax=Paracoccus amoyensis TaxID=2760093 RepID=A0A926GMG5_9RHOB|nr:VOC family protein [Paracoccus amoyensis]MBC9246605.1 VOC family protein [Paracoccus amoyensis]
MKDIPPVIGTLESALYADDLDAAKAFWTGIMGLKVITALPDRHVFFRVADKPYPQVLLIFRASATEVPPDPDARLPVPPHGARGPGHFCLAVHADSLDAWRSHLEVRGIAIEADFRWPTGARSIYVRDPAGNSIELGEPKMWE